MSHAKTSLFRSALEQRLATGLVVLLGALAGSMWAIVGDRYHVIDPWWVVLKAEIGALIAFFSWVYITLVLSKIFKEDIRKVRKVDALTYLPLLLSSVVSLNLVFQAGKLENIVFWVVLLLFVCLKVIELVWLAISRHQKFLKGALPIVLSLALVSFAVYKAWKAFVGDVDYWEDGEVISLPGDGEPFFSGAGAVRKHLNTAGRWRPVTTMLDGRTYQSEFDVVGNSLVKFGFIAKDEKNAQVRVSCFRDGESLSDEVIQAGGDWVEKSWHIKKEGKVSISVTPRGGDIFVSDPTILKDDGRPNILLLVIDTLRADHLSAYGYPRPTSPNLDTLAKRGILFENHFSTSSWSTSAVAGIFTGLYPAQHGCVDWKGLFLPLELETMAEPLKRAGYRTVGVSGNPLLSTKLGFSQGFDVFNEVCFDYVYWRSGECMTDQALADVGSDKPEFLFMQYFDPHAPYVAPKPEWLMFRGREFAYNPGKALKFITNRYDEMIRYSDRQIARLLDNLESRGWLDNAVVIITADHGEELGERGRVTHGYTLYDEVTHVPLIIFGSGIPANRRIQSVTSSIDLLPTILALAKVPYTLGQGRNLLELATSAREWVFMDNIFQTAVRTTRWKLLVTIGKQDELFDIVTDPRELNNVASRYPHELALLRKMLGESLEEVKKISPPTSHARKLDVDMIKRLRALGYIH